MLGRCVACQGFLPSNVSCCPNCEAAQPDAPADGGGRASLLKRAGILVAAAAASMTLMACYGAPGGYYEGCYADSECGAGYFCDETTSQCMAAAAEQCTNGVDDDLDGLVDCEDTNSCTCTYEASCNNAFDDDRDGLEDCADPDCASLCVAEEICGDHIDNDHDGLTDCQDPICDCGFETSCANGVDDDQDGYFDCQDPDCSSQCSVHETECQNTLDDDLDGLIDCLDPDCLTQAVCGGHELQCHDGKDDDLDGAIDCKDGDCPACPATETICDDLYDDDADGLVDCEDDDCATACATGGCGDGAVADGEQCDDGNMASGDGCSANCVVEIAAYCASLAALPMGPTTGTTADATNAFAGTCTPSSGFEVGYAFTPPSSGTLYLTLDSAVDMALVVNLGCGDFANELECQNAASAGDLEAVAIDVPGGAPLTVFIDSAAGTPGAFTLIANFVPQN